MSLISIHYRRMTTFVYLLVFLLIFNLIFNLHFQWYGISIIVRVYLFVFSFYLIYNYSTIDVERLKELYRKRFGKKGSIIVLFEMGVVPLLIIYGITIIFTFVDYLRLPNWPWNPLLSLLNGRYSNLVIYSLLLFIIMKTGSRPGIKIVIFFGVSVLYFLADKYLSSVIFAGAGLLVLKFIKLLVIFFFLFFGFLSERNKKWSLLYASASTSIIIALLLGGYALIFRYSPVSSYQHMVSGLALMKLGFSYPVYDLADTIAEKGAVSFSRDFISLSKHIRCDIIFTSAQWEKLLFAEKIDHADYIAGIILSIPQEIPFARLVDYAMEQSLKSPSRLESASNYIALVAKNSAGRAEQIKNKIIGSNENFKLFAIAVFGEMKDINVVPLLLDYLTGIDFKLSDASYEALRKITDKDPAAEKGIQRNDPYVISTFYEYYKNNRTKR